MNVRKHLGLFIAGGISLVVLIGVLIMLTRFHGAYRKVDRQLQSGLNRLNALNQQKPYPSEANVEAAEERLQSLEGYLNTLRDELRDDQVEPEDMEPAEFPPLLERIVRSLRSAAEEAEVVLPENLAFGFERYVAGALPEEGDIPRLVVEAKSIERIGKILFEAGVDEVTEIKRDTFELDEEKNTSDATSRGSTRRRPTRPGMRRQPEAQQTSSSDESESSDDSSLYSTEHFEIGFNAPESAVWDALNALARSDTFVVVTKLTIEGEDVTEKIAQQLKELEKENDREESSIAVRGLKSAYDERVVAGREAVQVVMEFDVYRFKAGGQQEDQS
jgi:hypothetical protein